MEARRKQSAENHVINQGEPEPRILKTKSRPLSNTLYYLCIHFKKKERKIRDSPYHSFTYSYRWIWGKKKGSKNKLIFSLYFP